METVTIAPPQRWEHFPHEADVGVRGFGATKEEAFAQAALALTAIITNPEDVQTDHLMAVSCEGPDDELLFAEWLNAVIYKIAQSGMLFSRFEVKLDDHHLDAVMWGEKVDVVRHQPAVEIKGATYTELHVGRTETGEWLAQCVLDV